MHQFHTVVVPSCPTTATIGTNPYVAGFARQLEQARKQKGRVYQTYVDGQGNEKFVFVTTSKDMPLGLGQLSDLGRTLLAKLLEYEFKDKRFGQLVLNLQSESEDDNDKSVLVSMTKDAIPDATRFVLSPAH